VGRYQCPTGWMTALSLLRNALMKLLLIEDDPDISAYLRKGLEQEGHVVDHADNGKDGLFLAATGKFDVLVIDRLLPEVSGLDVLRTLRTTGDKTPTLVLTALGGVDQRVEGFDAGADDYLVKPFAFSELLARLKALARRPPLQQAQTVLTCGKLRLDRLQRVVLAGDDVVDLQPREFSLLETLLLHKGEVLTRTMLLEKVWDFHFDPRTNIVETHVSRLRAKLGICKDVIQTIRGAGYSARETA
jgi:two-component system, OmpR family, response regulator